MGTDPGTQLVLAKVASMDGDYRRGWCGAVRCCYPSLSCSLQICFFRAS